MLSKIHSRSMAKLSDETLTMTFQLLRQLADAIEIASATEWVFFNRYGETSRTIGELEELQNARERLNQSYTRLNTLLLRILEAQPTAANAMLDLLATAIESGQANLDAANASIQEIKRGWNL
jgi:ribosomal protein L22